MNQAKPVGMTFLPASLRTKWHWQYEFQGNNIFQYNLRGNFTELVKQISNILHPDSLECTNDKHCPGGFCSGGMCCEYLCTQHYVWSVLDISEGLFIISSLSLLV